MDGLLETQRKIFNNSSNFLKTRSKFCQNSSKSLKNSIYRKFQIRPLCNSSKKSWKKFGKNLKELENELKNVPKSKVVSIKNSKTGTFQTAGAAQPIELSKKRRHFQLGFLKIIFEKFLKN